MDASKGQGKLYVNIAEAKNLPDSNGESLFCIVSSEKQKVQTKLVKEDSPIWNEHMFFDITDLTTSISISIMTSATNQEVGTTSIPLSALAHGKPVTESLRLSSKRPRGEINVKFLYQTNNQPIVPDDFECLHVLGRGNYAKVMQVRKKDTGRIYAMKVLNKKQIIKKEAVEGTLSERNVLKQLHHPFIVNLKYSFQTPEKLYLILDYVGGGELFYHLQLEQSFSEARAKFYTAEIVLALGYLHEHGIIYRDLKPENLLLDIEGHICLTDFGLCKEGLGFGEVTHTFCGSPEYLAPEMLAGKGYAKGVDWWALGTMLYEMITGLPPFFDEDPSIMIKKIQYDPLIFPENVSPDASSLISKLLIRDPAKRLGSGQADAEELKEHPWFKDIDWRLLYLRKVEAPFKPRLVSETDVRYFDPEFTNEDVKAPSPSSSPLDGSMGKRSGNDPFARFSMYVAPMEAFVLPSNGIPGKRQSRKLSSPLPVQIDLTKAAQEEKTS